MRIPLQSAQNHYLGITSRNPLVVRMHMLLLYCFALTPLLIYASKHRSSYQIMYFHALLLVSGSRQPLLYFLEAFLAGFAYANLWPLRVS